MIDEALFLRAFGRRKVVERLQNSLIPFGPGELPTSDDHRDFIRRLYTDIVHFRYFPSAPRGYIVHNKFNGVPRIVPAFTYRDVCVYYFCIKVLEDFIAVNRISGTFGGWRLGNPIWKKEYKEQKDRGLHYRDYGVPYGDSGTLYPPRWHENWGEYQNLANSFSHDYDGQHFLLYDVANFYDTISLSLLEARIRSVVSHDHSAVVDLLFQFLNNWNRGNVGYSSSRVGLPQDETSDCSRILANFFLQSYDVAMFQHCQATSPTSRYLRYADDHIIFSSSMSDARNLLYLASIELHRIGLNVNSSKAQVIVGKDQFRFHWSFDLFGLMEDRSDTIAVQSALEQIAETLVAERGSIQFPSWRKTSVLRRVLTVGLSPLSSQSRTEIVDALLTDEFITQSSAIQLMNLRSLLNENETTRLLTSTLSLLEVYPHNFFQISVLKALLDLLSDDEQRALAMKAFRPLAL